LDIEKRFRFICAIKITQAMQGKEKDPNPKHPSGKKRRDILSYSSK
jgi:hypothetical protein